MTANFCLRCGQPLEWRSVHGIDRRACISCDFVFWGDFSIGVGALVVRDGRFLLVRRAQDPGKGVWTNPGGYCEQLESIDDTVEREVLEETGVAAKVRGVVALRDQPRHIHNLYLAFAMDYVSGEPKADAVEVDDAGFFSFSEMETMNVAALTRWLVDVALHGPTHGMKRDLVSGVAVSSGALFRL